MKRLFKHLFPILLLCLSVILLLTACQSTPSDTDTTDGTAAVVEP